MGPTPTIDLVRIVSAPTYDADSDGVRDTFVRGDKILVDVEYNVPVTVTGTPRLRLQLGDDSNAVADNRQGMDLESVLHGGMTLRFAYTVDGHDTNTNRNDVDPDGVWVETVGSDNQVMFLPAEVSVVSAATGEAAELTKTGLPTAGTARPRSPRSTAARRRATEGRSRPARR